MSENVLWHDKRPIGLNKANGSRMVTFPAEFANLMAKKRKKPLFVKWTLDTVKMKVTGEVLGDERTNKAATRKGPARSTRKALKTRKRK